jgi:lipopolysaccharide biosynthesis glycosyltransferase
MQRPVALKAAFFHLARECFMPACCIVYTTDQGYLFPSIVSAMQARRHISPTKADIIIFGFAISPAAQDEVASICHAEGIHFMPVRTDVLEGADAMMARLFLNNFVPEHYTQFIYVDGDVQFCRPLEPLVDADVPAGRFLASNDPMTFLIPEQRGEGLILAEHLRLIGLNRHQASRYFNTGVLRINRAGWDEIGREAWKLCQRHAGPFRFPDQDPLNIVASDSHIPMSLAWNFPIFMLNARVADIIRPAVYHFMSRPKPWQGPFPPWTAAAQAVYTTALRCHPALAAYHRPFPIRQQVRYHMQQRYKRLTETVTWGFNRRRDRILDYERTVEFSSRGWREGIAMAPQALSCG